MTVGELIEKLFEFDLETRVVTHGTDEDGFEDVKVYLAKISGVIGGHSWTQYGFDDTESESCVIVDSW